MFSSGKSSASAVLLGLLVIVSFAMSHSAIQVEGTDWIEPALIWISICMPTGSGKSSLCKYLKLLVDNARENSGAAGADSEWWGCSTNARENFQATPT